MPAGIYIHVPFCLQKCNYCDFVSYPYFPGRAEEYLFALRKEMELVSRRLSPEEREAETVYVGGGTPTCLPARELEAVFSSCRQFFTFHPEAEISVEANPGTLDEEKLAVLREAGVNRLSIGVQACQDRLLLLLGRAHGYKEAKDAVRLAREAGLANLNLDLIFGLPGQTPGDWEECLHEILRLAPEHVSAYGLQLEEGTPLWRDVREGRVAPCSEEAELAMYRRAIELLTARGFEHYEISNFSLPGRQCRHNLRYWRNQPYLGFGPAAHSFWENCRWGNERSLSRYCGRLRAGELPVAEKEELDRETLMKETVFLGLRLTKGVDLAGFARRFGRNLEEVFSGPLKKLVRLGLVECEDGFLRLTAKGLPVANVVFAEFV